MGYCSILYYDGIDHLYLLWLRIYRLKLKALHRFNSTATAVEDITALQSGKLGKGLKKFLTNEVLEKSKLKDQQLLVVDPALCQCHLCPEPIHPIDFMSTSSTLHLQKAQYQCENCFIGT